MPNHTDYRIPADALQSLPVGTLSRGNGVGRISSPAVIDVPTFNNDTRRLITPTQGDPVLWYNDREPHTPTGQSVGWHVGRIAGPFAWQDDDQTHVCLGNASVHLRDTGTVSISGGPFQMFATAELLATWETLDVPFWSWAGLSSGAHRGYAFTLPRPLFVIPKELTAR